MDLHTSLERLDQRPYPAYKDLRGREFELDPYTLCVEHVQGDPFAAPSRLRIDLPADLMSLPAALIASSDARRASADFFQRALAAVLVDSPRGTGSGKSGVLEILATGPEVLDRSALQVFKTGAVRIRLSVGLPAAGRRILGRAAVELLVERLPRALDRVFPKPDLEALERHVHCVEDQVALRAQLDHAGLVAFLAEGSMLPRRSGVDSRPLVNAVPLSVPDSLSVTLDAPHAGRLRGMAIRKGVTLIVGGGYHGKSTLLSVVALGVYDHVPGDGRERVVTDANAITVRAEDGRAVRGVDLRPFIGELPLGRRTDLFDTDDASGSTSQAAAIVEALEAGATTLLIDEDTAATNFMIRDARMRALVPPEQEPITPYIDRVRQLWTEREVSSVLVVGGAGDYLDVADQVIQMDAYRPCDVSAEAAAVAKSLPLGGAAPRPPDPWPAACARRPAPSSLDPSKGKHSERVRSVKTRAIEFGREEIDLSLLFQLIDSAQCRSIGDLLLLLSRELVDGERSIPELLDAVEKMIDENGIDSVSERGYGDRARPRRFELAAALNRLRSLRLVASP